MLLYLDCDTGIDDALAVALLLAHRPAVTLAGIGTVDGNTSAAQAARNTLGLLALAGVTGVPVAAGTTSSSHRARHVHGDNGVGGVTLPAGGDPDRRTAVDLLLDLADEHAGDLHVLAIGPATNLARALRRSPRLTGQVASVTFMAGAVRVPGNVTPVAEANVRADPQAAADLLAADWPATLVPLDLSMGQRWAEADRQALAGGGSPLHRALAAMLPVYFDSYEPRLGERVIPLHDPLAAALVVGLVRPVGAPVLGLRVDVGESAVRESDDAPSRVPVVLAIDRPAGPVILRKILDG
ncbi:nucleoside hydrolase [Paractinoplanes rishiriensis]|uniref:Nucleoside hydrolase n=1 Tax=Paractinoplanes rishiriensis TaxID=1050105 RepID=A0A919K5C8_9ACTN|nr:nucleoside hydrolase [Actinoplanes rishiriensis]GIE98868.1 nucleoside hydrolase [Actinoplanes rishiriensis]